MLDAENKRNEEAKLTARLSSWANDKILDAKVAMYDRVGFRPAACVTLNDLEGIESQQIWHEFRSALFDADTLKEIELAGRQLELDVERHIHYKYERREFPKFTKGEADSYRDLEALKATTGLWE